MVNCITTSDFLNHESLKLSMDLPLNTFNGLKEESNKAGYNPLSMKEITSVEPTISHTKIEDTGFMKCLPVKSWYQGITHCTSTRDNRIDNKLTKNDSDMN